MIKSSSMPPAVVTNTSTLTRGGNAIHEGAELLSDEQVWRKLHHFVLSEEADALSDSAADEVRGVTEEDGAVILAGATR